MRIYTRTLHSFTLALAFVLGIASASLQAQNTGPAPTTLPGATTEIYKTIDDVSLPIHIYTPDGKASARPRPAIIFFFGGGWRGGTPAQFENHCKYLASRGMVGYENQGHGFFNYGKGDNSMFRATVNEMDAFLKSLGYLKGKPTIDSFMASLN
ncbi:MAG: hypothetical protein HOJ89_14260 [Opitutales bacterium]|nr:hypothetical protein [Opitutales bacterium]